MCIPQALAAAAITAAGTAYAANQQRQAQKEALAEARRAEEQAKAQAEEQRRRVETNVFRLADSQDTSRNRRGFSLRLFPEGPPSSASTGGASAPPTLGVQ